ncbi:MAG: polyphosphate kinase 1 [Pseudobdellovibrio sp.]
MSSTEKKIRKKRKVKNLEHPKSSSEIFNNRELGWLNFNLRVLHESQDKKNPLLERIKFLSISSSNLDEFFMKRVGGLKRQIAYGLTPKSSDGQTPKKQLQIIAKALGPMLTQQSLLLDQFRIELAHKGCEIVLYKNLKTAEKKFIREYFNKQIFPILTPLSVDPGHPFPFISNLSLSLGVSLLGPSKHDDDKIFARVKIPKLVDQWIQIDESHRYIHITEVIKAHINELFPQMKVQGTVTFKVTRNADSDREDDDDTEDLLAMIEEELRQRRFAEVVRVEFSNCTDPWLKAFLSKELELKEEDIYEMPAEFDLTDLSTLVSKLSWPKEKYPPWSPVVPAVLSEQISIFEQIRKHDILVHHPFESFSATVARFISEAAKDPNVLAIKMTLYRTGDNSSFIKALIEAAEAGKQVVCLIELQARFDEHRNIIWAQELENAGVHVVYGVVGLKTHAKTTLVVRKENNMVRSYAHIGTGNYNETTSRFYTDVGLLTSDDRITSELVEFFNYLTGKSMKTDYKHLLLAPINMFQKFKDLIAREADHAKQKRPALVMAKFNNMEENDISLSLYEASQAGVQVNLIVRGFCCIKPLTKKLSEKINVQSTIGRFLEHSRIFYFRNGMENPVDGDFFIGSADWMYRNLHARVEAITPIYDKIAKEKLWDILQSYWGDQAQSWVMQSDGSYLKKQITESKHMAGVQTDMMNKALQKITLTEDDLVPHDDEE